MRHDRLARGSPSAATARAAPGASPRTSVSSGGASSAIVAEQLEHLAAPPRRPRDRAADDLRAHRVERVVEAGHHAEVAAAAAQPPEQIGVLASRSRGPPARRRSPRPSRHVVAGPAEAARQVAEPAAQREAGDAGRGDESQHRGEAVHLGLAVHVAQQAAGLRVREPRLPGPPRRRASATCRASARRRATARPAMLWPPPLIESSSPCSRANSTQATTSADAEAADHQRGPAVDHGVPEAARVVVAGIAGADELAAQARAQGGDRGSVDYVLDGSGVGGAWRQRSSLVGHGGSSWSGGWQHRSAD